MPGGTSKLSCSSSRFSTAPSYVAELGATADAWQRLLKIQTPPRLPASPEDIMGFPLADPLRRSLESFSVPVPQRSGLRVLLIVEGGGTDAIVRLEALRSGGVGIDEEQAPLSQCWVDYGNDARALIPDATIRSIVSWLSARAA